MDWTQFGLFVLAVSGLFFWNRTEANNDRRDLFKMVSDGQKEIRDVIVEMRNESKDFHGRLCAIEEKYHQLDRRK